ncbi:hypothetical protein ISN45_Aa04g008390 [Arabidopsis thaliana x Arabidopsis arenosa]|uniref:Uncharacterized protein n=1 Tax=Arabidopsis thaliana x Arabidopsis arenosa TaxID=1240361 RepID=A0A8T2A8H2_9BRAS|nr:hypothetical protein ISN45_Aa04g008390 [Arabidopsis thaliana x Arabidopsis arenosa]
MDRCTLYHSSSAPNSPPSELSSPLPSNSPMFDVHRFYRWTGRSQQEVGFRLSSVTSRSVEPIYPWDRVPVNGNGLDFEPAAHPKDWLRYEFDKHGDMSVALWYYCLTHDGSSCEYRLGSPDALGPVSDEDDEDSSDGTNHLYVEEAESSRRVRRRIETVKKIEPGGRDFIPGRISYPHDFLANFDGRVRAKMQDWLVKLEGHHAASIKRHGQLVKELEDLERGIWEMEAHPKDWVRNGLERVGHIPEELREYCVTHDRRSCEVSSSEVENDQSPDIIRRVREDDFCFLGVFIAAGHAYKQSVYSNEVMRTANLHEIFENGEYANVESIYRHFLLTCLEYGNPTAKYMVSLRILTQVGPSQEALDLLVEDGKEILDGFLQRVDDLAEGVMIAKHVEREIDAMGLLGFRIFWDVFNHHNFPRFACYTIR